MQEFVKEVVNELTIETLSNIKDEHHIGTLKECVHEYYGAIKMLETVGLITMEESVDLVLNFTIKFTLPFFDDYNHILFQIEESGHEKDKQIHIWGYDSKDEEYEFVEFYFFQKLCKNIHTDIRVFVNENEQEQKNGYWKFNSKKSINDFVLHYNSKKKSTTIITLNHEDDNLIIQNLPCGFYILQWKET